MANILLWLDTLITTDEPGQASICAFLFEARQWAVTHGCDMNGFTFPPVGQWWAGKPTPFKARARAGCRVWRIPADVAPAVATQQLAPILTLMDGRVMDIFECWLPGGLPPGWFVVYQTSTARLVCLADSCEEIKSPP